MPWGMLHSAARDGNLGSVRQLLRAGANINEKDLGVENKGAHVGGALVGRRGRVLTRGGAPQGGYTPLWLASSENHLDVVRFLLEADGVDKNARNHGGLAPLHAAVAFNHLEVVRALLRAGANKNAKDDGDWTPLHLATRDNHPEVVRALVAAGADVAVKNTDGKTPLDMTSVEAVKTLLREAASEQAAAGQLHAPRVAPTGPPAQPLACAICGQQGLLASPGQGRAEAPRGGHSLGVDFAALSVQAGGAAAGQQGGARPCVVCMERAPIMALLPCGHRCVCAECLARLNAGADRRCPICRDPVHGSVRVFDN
ncbi:ankyrin repeat-containing domain protein [Baffinella frigidus]|nr:ankyrin repeat-containing domain protein [Cryptophyta sp. CCMP2293]